MVGIGSHDSRRGFLQKLGGLAAGAVVNPGKGLLQLAGQTGAGFPELNRLISTAFHTSNQLENGRTDSTNSQDLFNQLGNVLSDLRDWFKKPDNFNRILLHTLDEQIKFAQEMNQRCPRKEYQEYLQRKIRDKGKLLSGTCNERKLLALANENLAEGFFNISDENDLSATVPQFLFKGLLKPRGAETVAMNPARNFLNFKKRQANEALAKDVRVRRNIRKNEQARARRTKTIERENPNNKNSNLEEVKRKAALRQIAAQILTLSTRDEPSSLPKVLSKNNHKEEDS